MNVLKDRYQICRLIRTARTAKFKSQKDFWNANQLPLKVSYPHYSAVENSKKFPDIRLVISVSKILGVDLRLACHTWARDQMPDSLTKSFFGPSIAEETFGGQSMSLVQIDDYYVFNTSQIPFMKAHPDTWKTLMFIASFERQTQLTRKIVRDSLGVESKEVDTIVSWLIEQGILIEKEKVLRCKTRWFHLPNNEDFKEVRDMNFRDTAIDLTQKIAVKDLVDKEACRVTVSRRLSRVQAQEIVAKLNEIVSYYGNLEDVGCEQYAMAVGFGARFRIFQS
jgi:hypothetical protein